jgi:hypothetical protein
MRICRRQKGPLTVNQRFRPSGTLIRHRASRHAPCGRRCLARALPGLTPSPRIDYVPPLVTPRFSGCATLRLGWETSEGQSAL